MFVYFFVFFFFFAIEGHQLPVAGQEIRWVLWDAECETPIPTRNRYLAFVMVIIPTGNKITTICWFGQVKQQQQQSRQRSDGASLNNSNEYFGYMTAERVLIGELKVV